MGWEGMDPYMLQQFVQKYATPAKPAPAPHYAMGLNQGPGPTLPDTTPDKNGGWGDAIIGRGMGTPPWLPQPGHGGRIGQMPIPNQNWPTPNNGGGRQLPPWLMNPMRTFAHGGVVGQQMPDWSQLLSMFGGGQGGMPMPQWMMAPQQGLPAWAQPSNQTQVGYAGGVNPGAMAQWWPGVWGGQRWPFMQGDFTQAEQSVQAPKYGRPMFENVDPRYATPNPQLNTKEWDAIMAGKQRMDPGDISYMNSMIGRLPIGYKKTPAWMDMLDAWKTGSAYDTSSANNKYMADIIKKMAMGNYFKTGEGNQGMGGYGGGDMGPGGYGGNAGDRASGE